MNFRRQNRSGLRPGVTLILGLLFIAACSTLPKARLYVTLVLNGQRQSLETESATVRDVLNEAGITLGDMDYVTPPETARLSSNLVITVTRVSQHTETFTETIPFGRQVVRDANIADGESRLLQSGASGILERTYRITLEDNKETERILVAETITKPPQDEMFLIGTKPQVQTLYITGTLTYLSQQDAWIIRESNRTRRRLTALGDLDGRVFTLSPDGKRLLFTRAVTEEEHLNELWVVSASEADPNALPLGMNDILWADWAPDGTEKSSRIAWTTAEVIERAPGWRGENDLWIGTLNTSNVLGSKRKILDAEAGGGYGWWGTRYAWDPQGKRLAYSQPESVGIVTLNQAKRTPLITFPGYRTYSSWAWNPSLSWDPNGDFIAITAHGRSPDGSDPEESPVFDFWLLEANGTYSAEVAAETGMWAMPTFSHDGERLLFGRAIVPYQSDTSEHRLCLIDRDGSNARCIYPAEEGSGVETPTWQWGPDNRTVAFIRHGDIYLLSLDDETALPLTDEGTITMLAWQ